MYKWLPFLFLFNCQFLVAQKTSSADSIAGLIQKYQYKQALELVNRGFIRKEDEATLFYFKGLAYKGLLKYPEAIFAFDNALSIDSLNYQVYIDQAYCYKALGNSVRAIQRLQIANHLKPDNISIQTEIAGLLMATEDYVKALDIYLNLYDKDSLNIFLLRSIGKSFESLEKADSAIHYYEKVIRLSPFDYQSVVRLANLYIKQNQYKPAIFILENYRFQDPSNTKVNRLKAYTYYLLQDFKASTQNFLRCIRNNDTTDFTYKFLGMSYFRVNQYDSAKVYLEKSFLKDSTNFQTCYALGIACKMAGLKEEGVFYLNQTLQLITPSLKLESEVLQQLAEAYNNCGNYKEGLRFFLSAYRVTPNDTLLKFRLAAQYDDKLSDKTRALKYYAEFMKTRPQKKDNQSSNSSGLSYYSAVEKRMIQLRKETQVRSH